MSIEPVLPSISSSVVPFSSRLRSFPRSGSFPMSQFCLSGGRSIRVSAPATVLPTNIQDWFSLGLAGLISLQFKGLSTVFSNTTGALNTTVLEAPGHAGISPFGETLRIAVKRREAKNKGEKEKI